MGDGFRVCVLCSGLDGVEFLASGDGLAGDSFVGRWYVKVVLLREGGKLIRGSRGLVVVGLSGDFLKDVLSVMNELRGCRRVKAFVIDGSPYRAAVALTAATIMYDKVTEFTVRCEVTPEEACVINAALPHALGGREGRAVRLRILMETAGKCVTLSEVSEKLGLTPQTTLRHAYTLAAAKLVNIKTLDGNPVVCGEVPGQVVGIIKAILMTYGGIKKAK